MNGPAISTLHCNGEKITHLVIPDSVAEINFYTFNGCETLQSITIPKSVTRVQFNAFMNCTGVTDVYYAGTQKEWKGLFWNNELMGNYTIHCSDGDIQK